MIVSIEEAGAGLAEAASLAAVVAGSFYHDREAQILYLRTTGSVNPGTVFMALTFRMFFSRGGVRKPHDLATGFEVYWRPLLKDTSEFGVELDNQNQLGVAIEGAGNVTFFNDQDFWGPIYDKLYFENQRVLIYSWNRHLPITEAKIIYRGRVQGKTWALDQVAFSLKDIFNELRAKIAVPLLSELPDIRITDRQANARQRRIYGYVFGHRPTNIDQPLDTYPLSGIVSVATGGTTLTGSGTQFLNDLSPDDELTLGDDESRVSVLTVDSDTQVTLSEAYSGANKTDVDFTIKPSHPKRYINREFLIAGHALREPVATVVRAPLPSYLEVDSTADLRAGDPLIFGDEQTAIRRVISGNRIKLTTALQNTPAPGDEIFRPAVSGVFLNTRPLVFNRDYDYSPADGTFTLDPLAEFHVAPVQHLRGTVAFTNGSRTVTGTDTAFSAEVKPGHWVRAAGEGVFFEVLQVVSDVELTLRVPASYTVDVGARIKRPEVYDEGHVVLTCDVLGATDDGTPDGVLLTRAPQIVRDLLELAEVEVGINEDSFETAVDLVDQRLGLVIPKKVDDTVVPTYRDTINQVNQSVFGSMIQNEDFQLEFSVLSPKKATGLAEFSEKDVLSLTVDSSSDKIVRNSKVNYLFREYDPVSAAGIYSVAQKESESARYLAKTDKEFSIDTILVDSIDAQIYANRWAFIFEVASSVLKVRTKLQAARLQINDQVAIRHAKLYERVGSQDRRKVALIQKASRSMVGCSIDISDLANAFSRCATITENTCPNWGGSGAKQRALNGYITDNSGLQQGDAETFGTNLIW